MVAGYYHDNHPVVGRRLSWNGVAYHYTDNGEHPVLGYHFNKEDA